MPRSALTLTSTNGIATSIYQAGPPALANAGSLRYIGNPVHNGEITIVSDGTIDFGTVSPYVIHALMLDNVTPGTDFVINGSTMEVGQQVKSCAYTSTSLVNLKLHSVPDLPYGVGIAMATYNDAGTQRWGKIETETKETYDYVFKYEIGVFPAANQANCITFGVGGTQIKGSWDFYGATGTSDNSFIDAYTGVFGPGQSFQEPPLVACNSGFAGSVVYHTPTKNLGVMVDTTHFRTTPIVTARALKFSTTQGAVYERAVDTGFGTLCNYHTNVNLDVTQTRPHPNLHHFPGNIQNITIDQGMQYYLGERVIFARSPARVEICDTPEPQTDINSATKTRKFAVALPRLWTRHFIRVRLREQIFAGQSLIGKYLHVYGHATATYPAGQFLGSILITGEVTQ